MKIHFFVRTLNEARGGGSHHNAISFIRALRERGHEVTVHAFVADNNAPPRDIELVTHAGARLGLAKAKAYLCALFSEYEDQADIFFLYGIDFTWGAGEYRMHGKTPVVVYLDTYLDSMGLTRDDSLSFWSTARYRIKRLVWDKTLGLRYARHVDQFLAVSPFVRDIFIKFGFPKEKFAVIPNFFTIPASVARALHDGPVRLLYIGRFMHDKGTDLLLQALAGLKDLNWSLRLVGSGPQQEHMTEYIGKNKLQSRVEIIPWASQQALESEYANADVFVHPARWPEPFGRTIVEAMLRGLPVVVPAQGGAAWIAGDAGLTFQNGDGRTLRAALKRVITDAGLRTSLARNCPAGAAMFSEKAVVPELERVLQAVYTGKHL